MYEIGLDLRIKGGKIVLTYRGEEYVIRSNPREPDIYICQNDVILHTLRNGFFTEQIEKMIIRDKEFKSATGCMIGREQLSDILASTIDDGRDSLTFGYAEELGRQRSNKRHERWERNYQLRLEEETIRRKEVRGMKTNEKPNVTNKYDYSSNKFFYMSNLFFYRGEAEREFYLVFSTAHDLDEYYIRVGDEEGVEPEKPLGTIIVPKEYENCWITRQRYYLDWEVVVVPVEGRFIKGYNNPYWKLLKDNTNAEPSGYKYTLFQDPEGRVFATTPLTELVIADTLEEYQQMSEEKVRSMCYCSEMSRAR